MGGAALAAYATTLVTPKPEAFMIKQLFNRPYGIKNPTMYEAASGRVKVLEDLSFSSHFENSTYDLYLPIDLADNEKLPLVVWLHGGGFVGGDKSQMHEFATYLTARSRVVVATLNYGLAPKNKYPYQLNQLATAICYFKEEPTLAEHLDCSRIIIGGDSAGAQIAGQYVLMQTNDAYRESMGHKQSLETEQIKGFISYCGPLAMSRLATHPHESRMVRYMLHTISRSIIKSREWTQQAELFEASITDHVNSCFPPSYVTDGNTRTFDMQGQAFTQRLKELKVPVVERFFADTDRKVMHEYQFEYLTDDALVCLDETCAFIDEVLQEMKDDNGRSMYLKEIK